MPGHGVVHAQAYYSLDGRDRAAEMLGLGDAPADIVAMITDASFDRNAAIRQYGLVDVLGKAAGYTGSGTMSYAGDGQGHVAHFAYSVQGNILTSKKVLEQAAAAFEAGGCDLAERLMSALEAGARGGEGDSRCTGKGIPSDSAFLQIESPGAAEGDYLSLHIESSGEENPLPGLRAKLDAWRVQHPCPVTTATKSAAKDEPSCGCRHAGAPPGDVTSWLLGGSLIVAGWRQRAARQRRPIHTP